MIKALAPLLLSLVIAPISKAENVNNQTCRTTATTELEYLDVKISKSKTIERALEDATLSSQMTCCTMVTNIAFTYFAPLKNQAIEELKTSQKLTDAEAGKTPLKFTIEGCKYRLE